MSLLSVARVVLLLAITALLPLPVVALQPVSPDLFQKLVRYTYFAAAAYSDNCVYTPYQSRVIQYLYAATTDSHATLFRDDKAKEVIIVFRGTVSAQNYETDFSIALVPLILPGTKCLGCKVHQGFQNAYLSLNNDVASAIRAELLRDPDSKLIVVGHSLGAALAAMAATSLVGQGFPVAETYTFGEPRNGDLAFSRFVTAQPFNRNYFRVTHFNDGVPQVPPTYLAYVHHGDEFWQSKQDNNTAETTFDCGPDSHASFLSMLCFPFLRLLHPGPPPPLATEQKSQIRPPP
ncbi:ferulic acid esterase A faeA [Moelleriella libera RCEF 2490]|uniref:Ferulic acid esterase A faeA n=1 Tax=Moelleriella libera RCEF 2490 TaxID=1081109 RepID=A0A166UWS9_9HYPO|nr:ferulic acid esterase A faeA [Moelleriella libera RCEF 2490]